MSMIPAALLHSISASVMIWGFNQLDTLVSDAWIREQTGGHWQYLTVLGLGAACLTMVSALGGDLFPSIQVFRKAQRILLMVSLPVAAVVAAVYWTLLLLFPALILPPLPGWTSEPSSSPATPPLMRVPLAIDLALHASPIAALVTEFYLYQTPFASHDVTFIAPIFLGLSGMGYALWAEYCAKHNGQFPYPFLTENPLKNRIAIYVGVTLIALFILRGFNRVHPHGKKGI